MFDSMVLRCMPNSGHGEAPGTPFMAILGLMSDLIFLILDILMYMGVYEGV